MNDKYLTVTALTRYIKRKIDSDSHLKDIWLKGEISNFKHHSRGHMYFTIKDEQTRVQAVMFAGNNQRLKFTPENGMNVLIRGDISVFEFYGQYQLYIKQMEPDGIGALYLAYEQLKEKLAKQGLFDEQLKKKLPIFPKHIGIVTSPSGAAVRDIITTISRRYPLTKTTIIPALVQGEMAPESIKNAIERANQKTSFDVLIVGRGGGSIEDLWCFNDEIVAHAIFHSNLPIISAVGHETDHTISDFVADLRAPTPTAAAEIAVPSKIELNEKVTHLKRFLSKLMDRKIETSKQHLYQIKQSYAFRYPENLIKQKEQELDTYTERMTKEFSQRLEGKKESFDFIIKRLITQHPKEQFYNATTKLNQLIKQKNRNMAHHFDQKANHLAGEIEKLSLLNPLEILKRGFGIPYTESGKIIKTSKQVHKNDIITLRLLDGLVNCKVSNVKEDNNAN